MQFKFSSLLRSSLLLSPGLFLVPTILISVAEARIASNGTVLNGTNLEFGSSSTAQLQLEGSQLVLHLNR